MSSDYTTRFGEQYDINFARAAGFPDRFAFYRFCNFVGEDNALFICSEMISHYQEYNEFGKAMFNNIRKFYTNTNNRYHTPLSEKQKIGLLKTCNYVRNQRIANLRAQVAYDRYINSAKGRFKRQELAWELRHEK